MNTIEFIEETEICERSLRRLADSRGLLLSKNNNTYQIFGKGISGIELSDDETWSVLQTFPQHYTLSGRYDPVA